MPTTMKNTDKAIAILRATCDGDKLTPGHLALLQDAVNGPLVDYRQETFDKIYTDVLAGSYVPPWFCGIPCLTQDHEGYVYWKGHNVEHYSFRDNKKGELAAARELASRCLWLEANNRPVSCLSAVWNWDHNRDLSTFQTTAA
jgi:hypothetical protein